MCVCWSGNVRGSELIEFRHVWFNTLSEVKPEDLNIGVTHTHTRTRVRTHTHTLVSASLLLLSLVIPAG